MHRTRLSQRIKTTAAKKPQAVAAGCAARGPVFPARASASRSSRLTLVVTEPTGHVRPGENMQ